MDNSNSAPSSQRLFIGIKVEPDIVICNLIDRLKNELSGSKIKWTDIENLHLTIRFLGNVERNDFKQIEKTLSEISIGKKEFSFTIKSVGTFGKPMPKILWLGIEPNKYLTSIYDQITLGLAHLYPDWENKPFSPHLTIGRIKYMPQRQLLTSLVNNYKDYMFQDVKVNEIILFESRLFKSGAIHQVIARQELN